MIVNLISAVVAGIIGFLVAFLNYLISKIVLLKAPQKYSVTTVLRQVLHIGFMVAVYFIVSKIEQINLVYVLVGSVLGMTLPMIFFTKKLLEYNNQLNGKGDKDDG